MQEHKVRPEDYELVFGNPTGELVLEDLLRGFHFYDPMYKPGQNTNDLVFREGQRSVVLWIKNTLDGVQGGQELDENYLMEDDIDGNRQPSGISPKSHFTDF